jgi:hypothetical protein
MKKTVVIVLAVLVVVAAGILYSMANYGPKLSEVEYLLKPRITEKENAGVIEVTAKGAPAGISGKAIGFLFKVYFKIKEAPKGPKMPAPRARWPMPKEVPETEWVGMFAMPVPAGVTSLPHVEPPSGIKVALTTWEYGEVAEILHVGPYNTENTTVEKLHRFIEDSGYEVAGPHEEEYLKGPSFIPTSPAKYLTVIRYRVRKKTVPGQESADGTTVL